MPTGVLNEAAPSPHEVTLLFLSAHAPVFSSPRTNEAARIDRREKRCPKPRIEAGQALLRVTGEIAAAHKK